MELSASSVSVVTLLLFVHITPLRSERIVPRIVPSKLQLFEYSPLTVNCEGFFNNMTQWRVVRIMKGSTTPCNTSAPFGPCFIRNMYPSDATEYWCESTDRYWRSERVWITVKAGGVVLESPVRPVTVGDRVTLRCIEKKDKKSSKFFFYKDRVKINSSSDGEMTIKNVSESDQGTYKCSTSDGKSMSGENLLQVKAVLLQCPDRPVMEGTSLTLFCTDKMAAPNHTTVFFKDGEVIVDSSSGTFTLNVSKSDEGVYKCRGSEGRESEEQWLSVTAGPVTSAPEVPGDRSILPFLFGLTALPLLLSVLPFIYKKYKGRGARARSETSAAVMKPKRGNQAPASEPEPAAIYSLIYEVDERPLPSNGPVSRRDDEVMYSTVNDHRPNVRRGNTERAARPSAELYSTVNKKKKKHEVTESGDVYSVVQKNQGKKPLAGAESFYDQVRC